ncbi:MAG TPA: tyrosine-protein phosphatase [Blastocatellia bacterium]|nr:tyrosine-protein phosphatase [Blastocatellia bacterium]
MIAFSLAIALCIASSARSHEKSEKSSSNSRTGSVEVAVDNFGKVTDFFFRGAQPKGAEYNQLAAIGVKTIIDLRDDPKDYAKALTEQAGMKYINFPLSDKDYPSPEAPSKFISLISDKENWPVYVHCAGGRHRTGAMIAVFRMSVQGWDVNRAYAEMKDYDFYTRWGHKDMKRFVFDYSRNLNNRQTDIHITDSINQ